MFTAWSATWRQWRWISGGMGRPVRDGLDWQQVQSALELGGVNREDWPGIFSGLRVMQAEALEALADQG